MALEQIEILADEGVDLSRVVIGHVDNHTDLDYVRRVLDRGVCIGFDSIGKQVWDTRQPRQLPTANGEFSKRALFRSDNIRAQWLAALISEGYQDQIVLSHDLIGAQVPLNPETHGQRGYTYLGTTFTQILLDHGVTTTDLDSLLRNNPARLLTVN